MTPAVPPSCSSPPSGVAVPGPAAPSHVSGNRIFGLDALRALAILGVIVAHALPVLYPHIAHLGLLGHGGFYGVELFFVLSGFLIGQILLKHGPALRAGSTLGVFYTRRWFRTLPLFGLFLVANAALELNLREHAISLREFAEHGLFLRSFTEHRLTFFAESWSLAIEEWFYLLFPAALWLGLRVSRRFDAVFLVATFAFYVGSTSARVLFADDPNATWHTSQRMLTVLRFDALMIGVAAAWIALRFGSAWRRHAKLCALAGWVLLVAMYVTLWAVHRGYFVAPPETFFARTFRFNLVSLGFAFLLPAASLWAAPGWKLAGGAVQKIALWSYAMYLAHSPIYALCRHFFFPQWQTNAAHGAALFSLQIGLTVLVSALVFRFYEAPCTRLRDKVAPLFLRRAAPAPAVVAPAVGPSRTG